MSACAREETELRGLRITATTVDGYEAAATLDRAAQADDGMLRASLTVRSEGRTDTATGTFLLRGKRLEATIFGQHFLLTRCPTDAPSPPRPPSPQGGA